MIFDGAPVTFPMDDFRGVAKTDDRPEQVRAVPAAMLAVPARFGAPELRGLVPAYRSRFEEECAA